MQFVDLKFPKYEKIFSFLGSVNMPPPATPGANPPTEQYYKRHFTTIYRCINQQMEKV